jgi:Right handed beta helix region
MRNSDQRFFTTGRAKLAIVCAVMGIGQSALADSYFVRTGGDDNNDGSTPMMAFATPAKAASIVSAGDSVFIGGGVYTTQIAPANSGTPGNLIRYIADSAGLETGDSGQVIIQTAGTPVVSLDGIGYTSFDGFTLRDGDSTIEIINSSNAITFNNCVIERSSTYGFLVTGGSSATMTNCTITASTRDAIRLEGSGAVVIRDCTIQVPTTYGIFARTNGDITIANCVFDRPVNSGHGIWVTPTNQTTPTAVTITGNDMSLKNDRYMSSGFENGWRSFWIASSAEGYQRVRYTYGIIVFGWGSPKVSRVEVSNNLVSDSFLGIYAGIYSSNAGTSESVIANNTVTGSFFSIYSFGYRAKSITVVNNIVDTSYYGLIAYSNQSSSSVVLSTLEHNITYPMAAFRRSFEFEVIESDPKFMDPKVGNFALQGGSLAIDAGVLYGAPAVDIGGRSRPVDGNKDGVAQIDIGAFELVGTPTRVRVVQWREIGTESNR